MADSPAALPYAFVLAMQVRDYECDMQGIVNNAVYQHYLEHARHEFLKSRGLDFAEITRQGINLVVTRAELDYLYPLRSGDQFEVRLRAERLTRLRFGFQQDIFRLADEKPILRARISGTGFNQEGRPVLPEELVQHMVDMRT